MTFVVPEISLVKVGRQKSASQVGGSGRGLSLNDQMGRPHSLSPQYPELLAPTMPFSSLQQSGWPQSDPAAEVL